MIASVVGNIRQFWLGLMDGSKRGNTVGAGEVGFVEEVEQIAGKISKIESLFKYM